MPLVQIYDNLWDASRSPIPAELEPRLFFCPDSTSTASGLISDAEVQAGLNATTGEFSVWLESAPGLTYTPYVDWLIPGQEREAPGKRARGHAEFKSFHPGEGGRLSDLAPGALVGFMWIGPTPPPAVQRGTRWLDTNPSSPDYGLIKRWS